MRLPLILANRLLGRLARDSRGASATELALLAPFLAVLVMGISDLSLGYSRKLEIEGAVARSLEKVAVGTVGTDYSVIRSEAATAAGVPLANVVLANWLECDRVVQGSFTGTCPVDQEVGRYISITVNSSYRPQFAYGPLVTTNGVVPLQAISRVRVQ